MDQSHSTDYNRMNDVLEVSNNSAVDTELSHGVPQLHVDYLFFEPESIQALYPEQTQSQPYHHGRMDQQSSQVSQFNLDQTWPAAHYQDFVYSEPVSYVTATSFGPQAVVTSTGKRPSVTATVMATSLSDPEDVSEALSPGDDATGRRRERRRAQNRAAQRAFRARKEETIKESSARLEVLESEIADLKTTNVTLNTAVNELKAQIVQLQLENADLERRAMYNRKDSGQIKLFINNETQGSPPNTPFNGSHRSISD